MHVHMVDRITVSRRDVKRTRDFVHLQLAMYATALFTQFRNLFYPVFSLALPEHRHVSNHPIFLVVGLLHFLACITTPKNGKVNDNQATGMKMNQLVQGYLGDESSVICNCPIMISVKQSCAE